MNQSVLLLFKDFFSIFIFLSQSVPFVFSFSCAHSHRSDGSSAVNMYIIISHTSDLHHMSGVSVFLR